MAEKTLEEKLYDYGVYNAWQFVVNTSKTIHTANFCKDAISSLISRMEKEHSDWEKNLFSQINEQESAVRKISVTTENLPVHKVSVADVEVDNSFLLDKLTKDFFQYCRNAFDSMAQIANAGCLAFRAKKLESVDFPCMLRVFQQQTYSTDFPTISAWFNQISGSAEYAYLDAFCNRTKHTCDVYLKVSMAFMGGDNKAIINPFFRKTTQHGKQNVKDYLTTVYDFVYKAFEDFIVALETEIAKATYVQNRYHHLNCYQQRLKDDESNDYAVIYISEETNGIAQMPDEIEVLLLRQYDDGEIVSKNCEIDTIYVRSQNDEHHYVGKYECIEPCGDDTLLRYRRYKKEILEPDKYPILYGIMQNWKTKHLFYHNNPFIDITTVSDMDEFLGRVQLPF